MLSIQARDDLWRKWFAWMEPRMRSSGLLDAGGLHRTEENEKTSSIAAEFIQEQRRGLEWDGPATQIAGFAATAGTKRIR